VSPTVRSLLGASLLLVAGAGAAAGHHSFAAEYDSNRPLTVTGTVVRLEWTNPHARLYVDAKDDAGTLQHWDFELGPPTSLMRRGWNRKSLQPGHMVTVDGFHSKTEPYVANARKVTLSDGREVFAGSSFDPGPPPQ
jgi:hypothetical protein